MDELNFDVAWFDADAQTQIAHPVIFDWTEERVAELTALRAAKWSAGQIGAKFGVTRNAVLGKCHRFLKIPGNTSKHPHAKEKRVRVLTPAGGNAWQRKRFVEQPHRPLADIPTRKIGFMDMAKHHCRWPLDERGADGLGICCGNTKTEHSSYCRFHHAVTHMVRA